MPTIFYDTQETDNPRNGTAVASPADLQSLLTAVRGRQPYFAMLEAGGRELLVGVGPTVGCAQFTDESALATMAVPSRPVKSEGFVEFLTGNTPTPVPARYAMAMVDVLRVARWFLEKEQRDPSVRWESI